MVTSPETSLATTHHAAYDSKVEGNVIITRVDAAMNWMRKNSMWPMPMGLACCAIEMMAAACSRFDLSRWRIAGNGADMIRPDICQAFVDAFASAGFRAEAFTPSYGLAEATLAVSVAPVGQGIVCDLVDEKKLAGEGFADSPSDTSKPARYRAIVDCGVALPGLTIEIRDGAGKALADRQIGRVLVKGLGLMQGYFRDPEATAACLSPDGWLDTGDMADPAACAGSDPTSSPTAERAIITRKNTPKMLL
jgi:acyl-CoA synthetase (AMP-forming)/AMP-acid ligase II